MEVDGRSYEELRAAAEEGDASSSEETSIVIRSGGLDGLRVLAEGADFVDFEYIVPGLVWHRRDLEEGSFVEARIAGCFHGRLVRPGWPALPSVAFRHEVAGRRALSVELLEAETEFLPLGLPPLPAPRRWSDVDGTHLDHRLAVEATRRGGTYPDRPVELSIPPAGGDSFRLRLHPLLWHGEGEELSLLRRLRFRVHLEACEGLAKAQASLGAALGAGAFLRISVEGAGWIRLGREDLVAAGVAVDEVDPRRFRLRRRGVEVPLLVTGDGDGRFDEGDGLAFFAGGHEDLYDDHDVHFLDWDCPSPRRLQELSEDPVAPEERTWIRRGVVVDPDEFYWGAVPGDDHENRWYADLRVDSLTGPVITTFEVAHLVAHAPEPATLWVELQPMTSDEERSPDHRVRLTLAGVVISEATWDGFERRFIGGPVPLALLHEGVNELEIEVLLADGVGYDRLLVNRLFLGHPRDLTPRDGRLRFEVEAGSWSFEVGPFDHRSVRVLDVTSAGEPGLFLDPEIVGEEGAWSLRFESESATSRDLLVVDEEAASVGVETERVDLSGWSSSPPEADLLIVAPSVFHEALLPLVERRRGQGMRVLLASPRRLYDEFAHGIASPVALRDAIAGIWEGGEGEALRYVLLVGDASYDYKDDLGTGRRPLVPTYMTGTPALGQAASDSFFADLDQDELPDVAVGRWPLRDAEAVRSMVDRLLAYEESGDSHVDWRLRVVGVSGDGEPIFAQASRDALDAMPAALAKVAVDRNACVDAAEANDAIQAAFEAGCLLFHYMGHGQIDMWGNEDLLPSATVDVLSNGLRKPVVLSATCLDGYFIDPQGTPCRAERLLTAPSGGAIAVWSSSGLASADAKEPLLRAFHHALFQGGSAVLGDCIREAQVSMLLNGDDPEGVVATHLLFGDPSMRLRVPAPDAPVAFAAEIVGNRRVRFSWAPSSGGPESLGFILERQDEGGGPWSAVSTELLTELSVEVDLAPGDTAAYRVRAVGTLPAFPSSPSQVLTVDLPADVGIHGGGGCSLGGDDQGGGALWPLAFFVPFLLRRRSRKPGGSHVAWHRMA